MRPHVNPRHKYVGAQFIDRNNSSQGVVLLKASNLCPCTTLSFVRTQPVCQPHRLFWCCYDVSRTIASSATIRAVEITTRPRGKRVISTPLIARLDAISLTADTTIARKNYIRRPLLQRTKSKRLLLLRRA